MKLTSSLLLKMLQCHKNAYVEHIKWRWNSNETLIETSLIAIWHISAMLYPFFREGERIILPRPFGRRKGCCGWWPLVLEEAINFPFDNFIGSTLFVWFLSFSSFHYRHVNLANVLNCILEVNQIWGKYPLSTNVPILWNIVTCTKFSSLSFPDARNFYEM